MSCTSCPRCLTRTTELLAATERYAFELARHMADRTPTTLVTFGKESREERTGQFEGSGYRGKRATFAANEPIRFLLR